MEYQLFRCTECSNLAAAYTRPRDCAACGGGGGFAHSSDFERVELSEVKRTP